jgi:hypothetical protein
LLTLAMHVYVGRFERLLDDHTIFAGAMDAGFRSV